MNAAGTAKNYLHVRRFHAQYLVSSEHPSPEDVKARLDSTLTKSLPAALKSLFSPLISDSDESIWLIRSLEVDVNTNAAWDRDQISGQWSAQIARTLVRTLQREGDGQDVLRFDDRPAYLARYLLDLSKGNARGKWYYESFEGLNMLPVSSALRTAICEEPETGLDALLRLSDRELNDVIHALSEQEARRVTGHLSGMTSDVDENRSFRALWNAWGRAGVQSLTKTEEWRNVLNLYVTVCRDERELGGTSLASAARALLRLDLLLAGSSTGDREKLVNALTGGDISALYLTAGTADAEVLSPLVRSPPDWIRDVAETLMEGKAGQAEKGTDESARRYTDFGGIFLLLPFLDDIPLNEATRGWDVYEEISNVNLLRFLVLLKCCGRSRAIKAFHDPLIRDLMEMSPSMDVSHVARWQEGIGNDRTAAFIEDLAHWRFESGAVEGKTLALTSVPLPGGPVAVLMDCRRGDWLFVGKYEVQNPGELIGRLAGTLSKLDDQSLLITDETFLGPLKDEITGYPVEKLCDDLMTHMADNDSSAAATLARLEKLPDDLDYLSLSEPFQVSLSLDCALSVVSQGVMRDFAWRLPGFARSGMPYLYNNFLDITASVEDETDRRVVRLGRPPLNLILNMTGMARKSFTLRWLDERRFVLFQDG